MKLSKPLLIAALPLSGAVEIEEVIRKVRAATDSGLVDLVELRVDYMDNPAEFDYGQIKGEKVLVTLRDFSEGGARRHPDNLKLRLLKFLDELGILYDVEMRFIENYGDAVNYEGKVVSYHNFDTTRRITFEELRDKVGRYLDGALIVKIATVPFPGYRSLLMSVLEMGDNIAVMPMSSNPQERIAFTLLGSKILFCYLESPTALGQVRCNDARLILDTINKYARTP